MIGSGWPKWVKFLPNLFFNGYQEESNIYSQLDIHLAPMRQRAGIKNKIVLPLTAGLPVVAYKSGVNGIDNCDNLFISDSISGFISILSSIINQNHFNLYIDNKIDVKFEVKQNISNWLNSDS